MRESPGTPGSFGVLPRIGRRRGPRWFALAVLGAFGLALAHGPEARAQIGHQPRVGAVPTPEGIDRARRAAEESARRAAQKPLAATAAPLPRILLTGYWPPTNEMVRRFSPNPAQNPLGWIGANWENRGYDVYAYFPEFSPPNCTSCGKGTGDLEVDYQDTSADFWPIANQLQPIAVITFSRGKNNMSWEVETNQYNRQTWVPDYVAPTQPTPAPPDASVPAGTLRPTKLPTQDIVNAVAAANLGLTPFICTAQDAGGFLSEFMAYHGVWYQDIHGSPAAPDWCVTAGHVHVGQQVSWPVATSAAEVTLRTVMDYVDDLRAAKVDQQDLGFGGPGSAVLAMSGEALSGGASADLLVYAAPASAPVVYFVGTSANPTPLGAGTFVPLPFVLSFTLVTNAAGSILLEDVPGGGGPLNVYLQCAYADGTLPGGFGLTNALKLDFLP